VHIVIDIDQIMGTAKLTETSVGLQEIPTSSIGAAAVDAGACAGMPTEQISLAPSTQVDRLPPFSSPPAPHQDTFEVQSAPHAGNGINGGSPPA